VSGLGQTAKALRIELRIRPHFFIWRSMENDTAWRINPLRGSEKIPLKTLQSWLPKEKNHPEYEKIKYMIEAKEKQMK
jgi:hypothetical protein